ncbi:MAG: GNAT family N-acetyltransferase [Alphaproteobacteria bacterium]|nr:GNAT family N-acetyltransferase [Alphaproteobacteria bacterium]
MTLVTERLVLRPLRRGDVDAVHVWASDPVVCEYTDWGPNDRAATEAFVAQAVARAGRGDAELGITERGVDEVVGVIRLSDGEVPSLGYNLAPSRWGRGYVTEAARALLAGRERAVASCHPCNARSRRVLARLGFSLVDVRGRLRWRWREGRPPVLGPTRERAATAEDLPFAWSIYRGTMKGRTEALPHPWHDEQQRAVVAGDLASGDARVVEAEGGVWPVAWYTLHDEGDHRRLGQLFVAPEHQGQGIGTRIVEAAWSSGRPLRLSVLRTNPRAAALYRRLGFVVEAEDAVRLHLVR